MTKTSSAEAVRPLIAGRYRLDVPIGEGGMAQIWRANDERLARSVAVKFLTLSTQGETREQMVHRFLREARLAAAVRHPNVVDVLDFGTTEDERPFMVMELLHGESLEERLCRDPSLTLLELVTIAVAVLDGLEAVHRAGIVHRDLKPDNVFLLDDVGVVRPKLLDFGVSRAAASEEQGRRSVLTTMEGRLVGTPEYMSPEQARGRRDIDWRSDLYSVGVMLYEAITGRLPYEADGLGDLIIEIAAGGAPPVSLLRPEAGQGISDVIERAMQVRREDRYHSARDMRSELLSAAEQSLGNDARASLPAPKLARHAPLASGARPAGSQIATSPAIPRPVARAVQATAHRWTVDSSRPPPPIRRGITALVGAIVLVAAGVGTYAYVRMQRDEAAITASQLPSATEALPAAGAPAQPIENAERLPEPSLAQRPDAPAPPPAQAPSIEVHLRGVPPRSVVSVDGQASRLEGGRLVLPRDGEPHRIGVRLGARRWEVRHVAAGNGSYVVRLRGQSRARAARSGGGEVPSGAADAEESGDVFRELDY